MFEKRNQALLPRSAFIWRLIRNILIGGIVFAPVVHRFFHKFHLDK